jgi:hypothetical protein
MANTCGNFDDTFQMAMIIGLVDAAFRLYYYREDFADAVLQTAITEEARNDVVNSNDFYQPEGNPSATAEDVVSFGEGRNKDDESIVAGDVTSPFSYLRGNILLNKLSFLTCCYVNFEVD